MSRPHSDCRARARGILDSLDTHALELANAAFGQGVSTTAIQMHQAFSTLANGGIRIEPSIAVDDIDSSGGARVVGERTASEVMAMMGDAVEYGTAQAAAVPGYEVAGKTGTAWQICPETGTYSCGNNVRHYTASFVGIVSNDSGPVLTITVIIDGSRGVNYAGGSAAAPVFAELAGYTLRQLRISPSTQTGGPRERVRAEAAVGPADTGDGAMSATLRRIIEELGDDVRSAPDADPDLAVDLDLMVDDVEHDSRAVRGATLFACVVGRAADGHDHAAAAVDQGAVALLVERRLDLHVPQIIVDDVRRAMGPAAAVVHGHPSRSVTVVGVTGTNGKTTTVALVADILALLGRPCAEIGTLTGARTTPEAPELQRLLAAARDRG